MLLNPQPTQLTLDEMEYWLELEGLLARFHQDLTRVQASLEGLGAQEVQDYLLAAQTAVGAACCAVVAISPRMGDPVS